MIDFTESDKEIEIVFYRTPRDRNEYKFEVENSNLIKEYEDNREVIKLYAPVKIDQVLKEDHKFIVKCTKCQDGIWETLTGPQITLKEILKDTKFEKNQEKDLSEIISNVYKNGSPETRKAMEESFIESQGTVLNSNWNQVKNEKNEK
ncbi:hypothetical protein A0H76_2789 [Hepatospora eriocheir]|uniref:SGS domain-containing protein n=1 Tax=Hepatospora eriocheir TaxID=1081669 RepID=A0A1X0QER0_9MICR|nr:hypothetical protein A0H76_2789 [Hepatospora eriocheir]